VRFHVTGALPETRAPGRDAVYLLPADWDDWFKFSTLFNVAYVDADGEIHDIGGVKIGRFGLAPGGKEADPRPGHRTPDPPPRFSRLGEEFFSLGQDTSYYEALTAVSASFREEFLRAMRDLAYDPDLLERAEAEQVTRVSLLREVPLSTVRDQFTRLAHGGARLTPYNFVFRYQVPPGADKIPVEFSVEPYSRPPSNIHVLIGRNGVGKITFLNAFAAEMVLGPAAPARQTRMAQSRTAQSRTAQSRARQSRTRARPSRTATRHQITNVVSVSFSAFDAFEPISVPQDRTKGPTYHYVGLKKVASRASRASRKDEPSAPKDPAALSREMTLSAKTCLVGARKPRLRRALRLLEGDPIFADAGLADLLEAAQDDQEVLDELPGIFRQLSSGHKIVLLTVTKLVETVEEKSLVLLDEPEAHLHPPLLSAFIRALSDLLTNRNGMAVVATHSPVVLQEVPRSCVWKLQRSGSALAVERPKIETFGENTGTLTDEIFGLEVTATGFHAMLADVADRAHGYEEALAEFDGRLGAEGRAILRAMIRPDGVRHVGQ
jgi:predicted ATPase